MNNPIQNPSGLPCALEFEGASLRIIDRDGLPWISAGDLGLALGYKRLGNQVASIYRQHQAEFNEEMTATISLAEARKHFSADSASKGNPGVPVRVFSPRGAHLIAMFARTEKAGKFRRWVLDVLERYQGAPRMLEPDAFSVHEAAIDLIEQQPGVAMRGVRLLLAWTTDAQPEVKMVPQSAMVVTPSDLPKLIRNHDVMTRAQIAGIAQACVLRLSETGKGATDE